MAWKPATAKVTRIGFIQSGSRQENHRLLDAFRENLSALGWTDGNNIAVFDRWAEERTEALPAIVKELIGSGVASWSPPEHRPHSPPSARARRFRSSWSASTIPSPLASPKAWGSPAATSPDYV